MGINAHENQRPKSTPKDQNHKTATAHGGKYYPITGANLAAFLLTPF
jgi:hypothetical protein